MVGNHGTIVLSTVNKLKRPKLKPFWTTRSTVISPRYSKTKFCVI